MGARPATRRIVDPRPLAIVFVSAWTLTAGTAFAGVVSGVDADVDPAFGDGGFVVAEYPFADEDVVAIDLAVAPDGSIYVLATARSHPFASEVPIVYRFSPDGAWDADFGTAGLAVLQIPSPTGLRSPAAMALQADGKIVVAIAVGTFSRDFGVARLTPEGDLDFTFDGDGYESYDLEPGLPESDDDVSSLIVQADQKILLVGSSNRPGGNTHFSVARLQSGGTLDPTFGFGGVNFGDFNLGAPTSLSVANAVDLDAAGRSVVAGIWSDGGSDVEWVVARLTTAGFFDPEFAGDGILRGDWTGFDPTSRDPELTDLAVGSDGRIVVVGETSTSSEVVGTQAVVETDGSIDPTFHDGNGVAFVRFLPSADRSGSLRLALDRSGMAIMSGQASTFEAQFLGLARTVDGAPHPAFSPNGIYVLNTAPGEPGTHFEGGVALDPEDRIVVAGTAGVLQGAPLNETRYRVFLTRLRGALVFVDGFETGDTSRWGA